MELAMAKRSIQKVHELIGQYTYEVKEQVEQIQNRLIAVAGLLSESLLIEKKLSLKIRDIQSDQSSFHDKVVNVSEKLKQCKRVLDSYQS